MTDIAQLDDLFFHRSGMQKPAVSRLTEEALAGMDDGELYLEYMQSESLHFDNGRLKNASFNTRQGFGLRAVKGEATGLAHASELSESAIRRAISTARAVHDQPTPAVPSLHAPFGSNAALYTDENPLHEVPFPEKVTLLETIDQYLRTKDSRVRQVSASLAGNWQAVEILRADGQCTGDIRPLVRLNVSVVVEKNGRMEQGSAGAGGRAHYREYISGSQWRRLADEALRQALVNLESVPARAGEMPVVLGSGWTGVLLHEAVGHGLEGDFNRKGSSAFSGRIGQRVAAPGVTVVDDGTLPGRRGSLTIDDEGTPTRHTVLIEDGILKGYMHDRMSARLMGMEASGNGRRESFAHPTLPRMTNTYMLSGDATQEEMIASVKHGIFAAHFGGGQVDITSGKFVFSATEAYKIENGKITAPIKGATLIGNGPDVLTRVKAIGNDMALDDGIGTCGKAGQSVPVGVGQPSLLVEGMTVGGTEL